jgi:hypothetical protein
MTEFSKGDRVEVSRWRWPKGSSPEFWWCTATVVKVLPDMVGVRYPDEGRALVRLGRGRIRRAEP